MGQFLGPETDVLGERYFMQEPKPQISIFVNCSPTCTVKIDTTVQVGLTNVYIALPKDFIFDKLRYCINKANY